jgi:hypothetical protein
MSDYLPPIIPGGQDINFDASHVVIGFGPDRGIIVPKQTFSRAFIFVSVGVSIALFGVVIGFAIWLLWRNRSTLPPPQPTIQDNFGSTTTTECGTGLDKTTCLTQGNLWTDKCTCRHGWYGRNCDKQTHDDKYFSLGNPYETNYDRLLSTNLTKRECGNLCDGTVGCKGFVWDGGVCELVGNVTVSSEGNIFHNPGIDSKLYMSSRDNIGFDGKIFLGKYAVSLPSRFWLQEETETYKQIQIGQVEYIDFVPAYFKTNSRRMGIYAPFEFSSNQISYVLIQRSRIVLHDTELPLTIPSSWEGKRIWVYYF